MTDQYAEQLNLPQGVYSPTKYANPSLQWHYRILQALALDEDLPAKPDDKTMPKYRQIDKRIGNEAIEWGKTLDATYKEYLAENPDAANIGTKRATGSSSANGRAGESKKVKTESDQSMSDADMKSLHDKGKVSTLTVAVLKEFCTAKRLPVSGKKADLVERVEGWCERQ